MFGMLVVMKGWYYVFSFLSSPFLYFELLLLSGLVGRSGESGRGGTQCVLSFVHNRMMPSLFISII